MSIINQLIYSSVKQPEKLNILSFFYDGKFDVELLKTGHNFYGVLDSTMYPWPGYRNADYPNLKLLPNINDIRNINFDLILFNSRQKHEQFFPLTKSLHVNGLIVDHDYIPTSSFFIKKHLEQFKLPSISTSDTVKNQFKNNTNIFYNIDQNIGEFDKDIDILIVGKFNESHFQWLGQLKQKFPNLKLVGHNPTVPFSETVETYQDYKNLFRRTRIFVNLPMQQNLSHELLWALQSNCAIISTSIPVYSEILNKDNCINITDVKDIETQINNLLHNPKRLKEATEYTVDLSKFHNNFIEDWTNTFKQYAGVYSDNR